MLEQKQSYDEGQASHLTLTHYVRPEDIPVADVLPVFHAYADWSYDLLRALGGPHFEVSAHMEAFFAHLDCVLPPKGAFFLAHDETGRIVGTGSLRRLSDDTAEMKHLYVSPEARCTGLGRDLIVARIAAARALGIKRLVAEAFLSNQPMMRLYRRIGFVEAGAYDSAVKNISPELLPFLRAFQMEL